MIHWTPEGARVKVGLNFYATKWWVRVVWRWYDAPSMKTSGWYLRFRLTMKPHWIYEKHAPTSVIDSYLFNTDQMLVTREQALDKQLIKE